MSPTLVVVAATALVPVLATPAFADAGTSAEKRWSDAIIRRCDTITETHRNGGWQVRYLGERGGLSQYKTYDRQWLFGWRWVGQQRYTLDCGR